MKKILIVTAMLSFSTVALADSMDDQGSRNLNTGCGLGSQVIKNQDTVLMQVFAATTNGTSGNQTFGITSGTLGCAKPEKFASNETNRFVAQNMDALATDIAMGQGEKLDTLATLLKVQDKPAFAVKLQQNFAAIYSDEQVTSAQVIDAILNIVG